MKIENQNYVRMAVTTVSIANNYKILWEANAPFKRYMAAIETELKNIGESEQGSGAITTGATTDKEKKADAAITEAVRLSNLASSYALDNDNHTLHDQIHKTDSSFDELGQEELEPALTDFANSLTALGTDAEEFGINKAAIDNLRVLTAAYQADKGKPREIIVTRKGHNANIPPAIRRMRATFVKMDGLAHNWPETPQFLIDYKNARIVIDL